MKVWVIFRSSNTPCLIKNVVACATQIPKGIDVSQIGIMFKSNFISSTLVTVDSRHGSCFLSAKSSSSIIAALSRNL